jgi:hypothetical protein
MNDPTGTLNESPEIERHLDTISTVYMAINTHNANPPKGTYQSSKKCIVF